MPVDATLVSVTLEGISFNNAGVAIQGGLVLDSNLQLNSSRLIFDDTNSQAVGVGSLVSAASILGGNIFNQSSQPVTFDSAITLSGSQSIDGLDYVASPQESYSGPIINRGAIVANGSQLTINATTWVNDGTIAATGGTLNLYGNWTNNGTISANSASTVSLGSAVAINPTSTAAAAYAWTNHGTINIAACATVYLGGVFTTDEYDGNFADRGVTVNLAADTVYLIGTMDNSTADNPDTQGTLALSAATGPLYLYGGEIYQGQVTTAGSDDLAATSSDGTLDGVTINGTLDMSQGQAGVTLLRGTLDSALNLSGSGTNLTVLGGLTLNADVYLSALYTYLYFNDTNPQTVGVGTLATGATIHMSSAGATIDNQSSQVVTLAPGITISDEQGPSSFNAPSNAINGPIDNQGIIQDETTNGILAINFDQYTESGLVRWSNDVTGLIHVVSDGVLELGGAWANYGTITADPNLYVPNNGGEINSLTRTVLGDDLNAGPYDLNNANSSFVDNGTITSDAWVNYGTIATNNANVYLGGWLSLDPAHTTSPRSTSARTPSS